MAIAKLGCLLSEQWCAQCCSAMMLLKQTSETLAVTCTQALRIIWACIH